MKFILFFLHISFLFGGNELLDSIENLPNAYESNESGDDNSTASIDVNKTLEEEKILFCKDPQYS